MFDPDSGFSRVVDLKGLLEIASWMQALVTFDKDGDYGVFADLLDAPVLNEAAFFERTTNPIKAREKLRGARTQLENMPAEDPIWDYFRPRMLTGFRWIDHSHRHEWEATLARRYLQKRDYLRSVLYALESCISRRVDEQKGDHKHFDDRKNAHEALMENEHYRQLNNLRNAMAHGAQSTRRDMAKALQSEQRLQDTLRHLYDKLLP
jgi:outer membrane receptor for ferric coprogen and ferric-rhodotorulic acid